MPLLTTTVIDHYRLFALPLEIPWNSTVVTDNIPSRIRLISTTSLVIVIVVVAIIHIPGFELQVRFACLNSLGFLLGSLPPVLLDILVIIFKSNGCIQQLLLSFHSYTRIDDPLVLQHKANTHNYIMHMCSELEFTHRTSHTMKIQ